jgi:hypothetical protein
MEVDADVAKTGIGAILGFLLAQTVGVARIAWTWWQRPKLKIKSSDSYCVDVRNVQTASGAPATEKHFGFEVSNAGRTAAINVWFQLLKVEVMHEGDWKVVSGGARNLFLHSESTPQRWERRTTLVPGAAVIIDLARCRSDNDVVVPQVRRRPRGYEDNAKDSKEYRFTVVAFDKTGYYDQAVLTIQSGE